MIHSVKFEMDKACVFFVKVFSRQTILFSLFRTIAFAFVILRVIIWKLCLHFLFIGIVLIVSFVELKTIGANISFFQKVYHLTWFIIGWTVNVKRCKAFSNTFKLCSFYFYYFLSFFSLFNIQHLSMHIAHPFLAMCISSIFPTLYFYYILVSFSTEKLITPNTSNISFFIYLQLFLLSWVGCLLKSCPFTIWVSTTKVFWTECLI